MAFIERALGFFEGAGIVTRRILTDNDANYRSHVFCDALSDRGIEVRKTRPYHPQTNGKAEAFVKIITNEWAYGRPYETNAERARLARPSPSTYSNRAVVCSRQESLVRVREGARPTCLRTGV